MPTRVKARSICESELIALVVCYHISVYRTFKWFYQRHVQKYWLAEFPGLPSYTPQLRQQLPQLRCIQKILFYNNSQRPSKTSGALL